MKIATLGTESRSHGVRGETHVTFEANSTAFYGQISGVSEDKIAYPIREISSNAWDVARGEVDVVLPSELNPIFSVRDRGTGLSPEFMTTRFCRMYDSSKRDDPTQLGGWGIGRFSPFAYLLSSEKTGFYMIVSWYEGVRTDYVMDLGSNGNPTLKVMGSTESNEPSGLMVSFSVMQKDIKAFHERAKEIYWAFEPRPNVTPDLGFTPCEPILQGSNWKLYGPNAPFTGPHVRIGCVMYPVDLTAGNGVVSPEKIITPSTNILFDAEIDSVQPTLSREDLAYDNRTISTINALFLNFHTESLRIMQERIDGEDNFFKAAKVLRLSTANFPPNIAERFYQTITWRHSRIPRRIDSQDSIRFMVMRNGWDRASITRFTGQSFDPGTLGEDTPVVFESGPELSFEKLEAAEMVGKKFLWVRANASSKDAALTMIGSPPNTITLNQFKVEGSAASRPKHIRKRVFMAITAGARYGQGPTETREVNLQDPHMYIRADRTSRYDQHYTGLNGVRMTADTLYGLTNMAINHRLIAAPILVMPVPMDEVAFTPPENWINFVEHMISLLKAHHSNGDSSAESWGMYYYGDFPETITGLRSITRPPFQKIGGDLTDFYTRVHAGIQLINNNYGGSRNTTLSGLLKRAGDTSPAADELTIPQRVAKEYVALTKKYPLLNKLSEPNGYVQRGSVKSRGILDNLEEYERLLMKQTPGKKPNIKYVAGALSDEDEGEIKMD